MARENSLLLAIHKRPTYCATRTYFTLLQDPTRVGYDIQMIDKHT